MRSHKPGYKHEAASGFERLDVSWSDMGCIQLAVPQILLPLSLLTPWRWPICRCRALRTSSLPTPTLRHVPAAARNACNQVLTRALAAVVTSNDKVFWRELLMLTKCVLCATGRGSVVGRNTSEPSLPSRLTAFSDGRKASGWLCGHPARSRANGPSISI